MKLRAACLEDAPVLGTLIGAFRDHLGVTRPTEEDLTSHLPRILADASTEFCLGFAEDGDAFGYTQCRFLPSVWASGLEAHLEDLFVVAAARGQGLGGELLRFALARAASRGAVSIGLHTNERNHAAQAFYRKAGFEPQSGPRWQDGHEVYWVRPIDPC